MRAGPRSLQDADFGAWSGALAATGPAPFRVEATIGHAWFARSDVRPGPPALRPETLPVLRRAELVLAGQGRAIARRATKIPPDAIVSVGGPAPASPTAVANDNQARLSPVARTALRELLFLAIFVATLAGTYYLGRLHAFHNVIVVPDAERWPSRIT